MYVPNRDGIIEKYGRKNEINQMVFISGQNIVNQSFLNGRKLFSKMNSICVNFTVMENSNNTFISHTKLTTRYFDDFGIKDFPLHLIIILNETVRLAERKENERAGKRKQKNEN